MANGWVCTAAADEGAVAALSQVTGKVSWRPPGASEAAAAPGQGLVFGAEVRTAPRSTAVIAFKDGSTLELRSGAHVQLGQESAIDHTGQTSVVVIYGRVLAHIAPSLASESFQLAAPLALVSVHGTAFEAGVAADGSTRLQVTGGAVRFSSGARGVEVTKGLEAQADEHGIGKLRPFSGHTDWPAWSAHQGRRWASSGKALAQVIAAQIGTDRDRLQGLASQREALIGAHAASLDKEGAGALALETQLQDLQKGANEVVGSALAKIGLVRDLLRHAPSMGVVVPAAALTNLRLAEKMAPAIETLVQQVTLPVVFTHSPPAARAPTDIAAAHLTALDGQLRALELAAMTANDTIRLSCVREAMGQFAALQSVAVLTIQAAHEASNRGDAAAETQIQARLQGLVGQCEKASKAASKCRGGTGGEQSAATNGAQVNQALLLATPAPTTVNVDDPTTEHAATYFDNALNPPPSNAVLLVRPAAASPYQ